VSAARGSTAAAVGLAPGTASLNNIQPSADVAVVQCQAATGHDRPSMELPLAPHLL
jgi:hypothetical protein